MNAAEILTAIQASGASLRVEGGSLVASNASRIAPEIKVAIRTNKLQIITALSEAVCAQCGAGNYEGASVGPADTGCTVEIVELPQALRYRKVFAFLQLQPPALVPVERWQRCVADGSRFLAQWGEPAELLGWSSADLFGLHKPPDNPHPSYSRLSRYDCLGLCWALQGRPVTMLTADSATIKTISGTLNFYRYNRPGFGPLGDSLDDFG
jgi:hypothetical protein